MNCKQHQQTIMARLKEQKLKVTPARVELLDIFEHAKKPLSVKNLFDLVKGRIDMVTLYRNVEALSELGVLNRLNIEANNASYELTGRYHHHHLVCENCGKVEDVERCNVEHIQPTILKSANFSTIKRHSLEFFGVCNACVKK